jgi:hypothetical protein
VPRFLPPSQVPHCRQSSPTTDRCCHILRELRYVSPRPHDWRDGFPDNRHELAPSFPFGTPPSTTESEGLTVDRPPPTPKPPHCHLPELAVDAVLLYDSRAGILDGLRDLAPPASLCPSVSSWRTTVGEYPTAPTPKSDTPSHRCAPPPLPPPTAISSSLDLVGATTPPWPPLPLLFHS